MNVSESDHKDNRFNLTIRDSKHAHKECAMCNYFDGNALVLGMSYPALKLWKNNVF